MTRSSRPSDQILMTDILRLEDVPMNSDETFVDRAKYVPSRGEAPTHDCVKVNPNANSSSSMRYLYEKVLKRDSHILPICAVIKLASQKYSR